MASPLDTEALRKKLLEYFTDGAPSYAAANDYQQALARMKTDDILAFITAEKEAWQREAVDNQWQNTLIPFETINKIGYVRLDWLMNELKKEGK